MKVKAAEVGVVMQWANQVLADYGADFHVEHLSRAGQSLAQYHNILRRLDDPIVDVCAQQKLMELTITSLCSMQAAGISDAPKLHAMVHLTARIFGETQLNRATPPPQSRARFDSPDSILSDFDGFRFRFHHTSDCDLGSDFSREAY
eukprot:9493412-Pyramimonas_sp.AAC.2